MPASSSWSPSTCWKTPRSARPSRTTPTIPQLYINGEFIGGVDIMAEMAESGELQKLIPEGNKAA